MTHVFIIGSKGIPAKYGGFETFVEHLISRKQNQEIMYHVSCMNNDEKHFEYHGTDCFNVKLPLPGAAGRLLHVGRALRTVERWVEENRKQTTGDKVIVYILGCRIGPLLIWYNKILHNLGVKIFCNPDGLEWKRKKWGIVAKQFLRYCEFCLVKYSDLVICDSKSIEKYINRKFPGVRTAYIAYGADVGKSKCENDKWNAWCQNFGIESKNYFLIVGRFVPDNNYETIIKEFIRSKTNKDLVIITNVEKNSFYNKLKKKSHFENDKRIKFVGTVYDQELLKKIREEAFAYIHGHEVGGTNPSLLEALASTEVNLLFNIIFNHEVGRDAGLYWEKEEGNLASLIEKTDKIYPNVNSRKEIAKKGIERIRDIYNWDKIISKYEKLFVSAGE